MNDTIKTILWVLVGVVICILLFCEIVVISCSVHGLTFGQQVCSWFGSKEVGQAAKTAAMIALK